MNTDSDGHFVAGEAPRRRFLETWGKAALAAPAAVLLLSAASRNAHADNAPLPLDYGRGDATKG